GQALQCNTGRGAGSRFRRGNKGTPLVHNQHVPNVSENTLGASGVAEGRIRRGDERFKKLVTNDNPNIIFKDEEGDGSDRIMSQRCKDKLNSLAISVMNTWPGVKLRVTEAWDEDGHHAKDSLHYEGRAVDITTSDKDRAKYGMLARLAVEAGFDWVYYESRGHIHCSVKSDSSAAIKIGGCFSGTSIVTTEGSGKIPMSELAVGDRVLSITSDGTLKYSDVITFLDRDKNRVGNFFNILTSDKRKITLTDKHILYVSHQNSSKLSDYLPVFAEKVTTNNYVLITHKDIEIKASKVVQIDTLSSSGVYAPLTYDGTIVVDDVIASCYGVIKNEYIAHASFAPMRAMHGILDYTSYFSRTNETQYPIGVHWYAELLYNIGKIVLGPEILYTVS
ncbi:hypothetical protein FSP39_001680, partial [Pinctada imbricata]